MSSIQSVCDLVVSACSEQPLANLASFSRGSEIALILPSCGAGSCS